MKDIVILVKVDEMYNIVKFASQVFIGREIKIELDDQRFCWRLPLNVHTLLRVSLLSGRLHLVRDTAAEKEFNIAI